MNKPDIRFNGFDGEWVEKKLGDCLCKSISNGIMNRPGINELKVKHINVVNMYAEDKIHINDLTYFLATEEDIKKCDVQVGDIFITRSSIKAEGIAQANVLLDKSNLVFDDHLMQLRFSKSFNPEFLKELLRSKSVRRQFILKGKTTTMTTIGQGEISSTDIFFPSPAEQTKIGNLFFQIDSLISSTQKEHDKLVSLKKCMLQKMFPKKGCLVPEIRFEGFSGDWEEKKISDLATIFIGLVTTMTKYYSNQGTLLIRNSDIKDNYFSFSDNPIYLNQEFADQNSSRKHKIGDVITVHTGDVGTSAVITEKEEGTIGFATIVTRPKTNLLDSIFLSIFLNSDAHKIWAVSVSTGDGRTNYNLGDYTQLLLKIPSLPEQQKIGSYFQNLDNLISKQSAELEKLKNVKKTLLSKMFV